MDGTPGGVGLRTLAADALAARCRASFERAFGRRAPVTGLAPARINVIGEHTDYNDGLALPGAVDRWTAVSLGPRDDERITIVSEAFADRPAAWRAGEARQEGLPRWSRLPIAVARVFAELRGVRGGFDAQVCSDVPVGAGLSSSAAFEVAMLVALRGGFEVEIEDLAIVRGARRAEHEGVGVPTGVLDQMAVLYARPRSLLLIDFLEPSHEHVPARLPGWRWVSIDTKVRRELAGAAYARRVQETRRGLDRVAAADSAVTSFRHLTLDHPELAEDELLRGRLRHYVGENRRVRETVAALGRDDPTAVGAALNASHASLRDDYEVSCAELDLLAETAAAHPSCAGARMMGGGFGGCVVALVREDAIEELAAVVEKPFVAAFGHLPEVSEHVLVGGAYLL